LPTEETISISIVICTYNGAERIEKVLSCFKNQVNVEQIEWEIIVVDNNSADNTSEIVNNMSSKFNVSVQVVRELQQGLIYARIKGYQASKYNIISYVDDDNYVANDWIFNVYQTMNENCDVGASGGYNSLYSDYMNFIPLWFNDFKHAYAVGQQSDDEQGYVQHLWGSGLSIRRGILDILFSTKYDLILTGRKGEGLSSGEDSEISYATTILGWKLFYTDKLKLQHHLSSARFTLEYIEELYAAFGKASVYLVPYVKFTKSKLLCIDKVRYSSSWKVKYFHNIMKLYFYYFLYILFFFTKKSKKYKLMIIFVSASNKELKKLNNNYKDIFSYIYILKKYRR
jgi:glycosyltransferase involved in cell wall biosynthesis